MKFLLGVVVGILGTLATTMLTSTPLGTTWVRYIQTALTGGLNHANAQRAVSKNLFDPFSAQFDGLRTVNYESREYVCGYVNAKNRMGAYIGNHQFVYDTLIGLALVNDDSDATKALKDRFQPCLPESMRTSKASKGPNTASVNDAAPVPNTSIPALKAEDFQASTDKSDPIAPPPKTASAAEPPAVSIAPPAPPQPAWTAIEEKSKIDDSSNVFIATSSKDPLPGRYGQKGRARITIACREGKTNLWVTFGGHFMSDYQFGTVTYRVDKRPAKKRHMRKSTDHQALGLWSAGETIPFAKELFGGASLFFEATPHSESAVTAEFDISGLEQAIQPLAKACKWPSTSKPKISTKPGAPRDLHSIR